MYRHIQLKMLAVILLVLFSRSLSFGMTASEFEKIIFKQHKPKTAHLKYNKKFFHKIDAENDKENIKSKITFANFDNYKYIEEKIDYQKKLVKKEDRDLRNIEELLKKYNIPEKYKSHVFLSGKALYTAKYHLFLKTSENTCGASLFPLPASSSSVETLFNKLYHGTIDINWLENQDINFHEEKVDGKNLLIVTTTNNKGREQIIRCDPAMDYRFFKYEARKNGILTKEIIADDYKMVNGYPYPFKYVEKTYSGDEIIRHSAYDIKEAHFDINLSKNDFKIFIEKGTKILDGLFSFKFHEIEESGMYGIDDLLDKFSKEK